MTRQLSTRDVARILGVRESRVRELARSGLCRPERKGRGYAFSFQDLVVLRAAQGLREQHVPPRRIHAGLTALAEQLPTDRPLSGLRIYADGRDVAVRDGESAWLPETGQTVLQFDLDELAEQVDALDKQAVPAQEPAGEATQGASVSGIAARWFERALALEETEPDAARAAYRSALEADPELVDALVNLGRLEHEAGHPREAAHLYHRAVELTPDDPVVHFNLGLALEDTSGPGPAAAHYERALELDPGFADAHYNLAGLCEQLGRRADAVRHYHAYKKLTDA